MPATFEPMRYTMTPTLRICVAFSAIATATPGFAAQTDANEAGVWLEGKSLQLIRGSRATMNDGTSAFLPQAGSGYNCFWLRDYAYMLEGSPEAFSKTELRKSCRTFIKGLRSDGAAVDCIAFDGTPIYKPGGGTMGENPVADGSQFTVDVAWRTHKQIQDVSFLNEIIDPLVKTMNAVPRDPTNGLVYIDPRKTYDRCPYGFTDTVRKTGDELFCSLLDVRAGNQLADLLDAVGRTSDAAAWRAKAKTESETIRNTFWDSSTGLFNAATVQCKQPDIWGSAFAVQLGIATTAQSKAIAQYFKDHYSEIVLNGQIRHLPGGMYWQSCGAAQKTYQNGGFWGVATGWFVGTLNLVDSNLAKQTVIDMVKNYQSNGVLEWINTGTSGGVANYVSSASLPLATLRTTLSLPDAPLLKETGGEFSTMSDNVAAASNGSTAFAKDVISGHAAHAIGHLNDGIYGNDHSWVAGSNNTFIGIAFSKPTDFNSLAFGRDNTGIYSDRFSGVYTFQYTTAANPNAATADSDWTSFGVVYLDATYPDISGSRRHRYEFNRITGATGVRIRIDGSGIGVDELEVYAIPEPSACLSTAIGLSSLASWRFKRSLFPNLCRRFAR
jgi:hypothetical protein